MATGSESEPNTTPFVNDPAPQGWKTVVPGYRFFRLDPSHPDYPEDWKQELDAETRTTLDRDPNVETAVAQVRFWWERLRQEIADTPTDDQRWGIRASPHLQTMRRMLDNAARAIGHPEIHHSVRRAYLAERVDPILLVLIPSAAHVEIQVNAEESEEHHAIEPLQPGEVMVRLSGVTRHDLQEKLLGFVTKAQDITGQDSRRKKGGRPLGSRQPERMQKCKAAAFMRRAGKDWRAIATHFDVSVSTARRMVQDGEQIIANEDHLASKGRQQTR